MDSSEWHRDDDDDISLAGLSDFVERRPKKIVNSSISHELLPVSILKKPSQHVPLCPTMIADSLPIRPTFQLPPRASQNSVDLPDWLYDDDFKRHEIPSEKHATKIFNNRPQDIPDVVPRERPITSTYIPGYGNIQITAPVQTVIAPPPIQQSMSYNYQQYEYQVPRDLFPNPCYDPVHQPQTFMAPPPPRFPHNSNFRNIRGGYNRQYQSIKNNFRTAESFSGTPNYLTPTTGRGYRCHSPFTSTADIGDEDMACDYGDTTLDSAAFPENPPNRWKKRNQFSTKTNASEFQKVSNLQKVAKRVSMKLSTSDSDKSRNVKNKGPTRLSEIRNSIEKGGIFKLGQRKKVEETLNEPSTASSQFNVESSNCSSPQGKEKDNTLELVTAILKSSVSKKEKTRLLNNPVELKKYYDKIKANLDHKEQAKAINSGNQPRSSQRKKLNPPKKKQRDNLTPEDVNDTTWSGVSSESETSSIISGVSTRSTSNRQKKRNTIVNSPTTKRGQMGKVGALCSTEATAKKSTAKTKKSAKKDASFEKETTKRNVVTQSESNESESIGETGSSSEECAQKLILAGGKNGNGNSTKTTAKLDLQQAIEEILNEALLKRQKKKKKKKEESSSGDGDKESSQNTDTGSRKTVNGGQIIGRNDIIVNTAVNKINLGNEHEESGMIGNEVVKKEEPTMEPEEQGYDSDSFITFAYPEVEVQLDCGD